MGENMSGLNRAQREIIRGMVMNRESGPRVRSTIDRLAKKEGWDYEANIRLVAELSAVSYPETSMHLEHKINRTDKCWVITTMYGEGSREWLQVRRRCPRAFKRNPLFFPSWCLYKVLGPSLARWGKSGRLSSEVCKRFVAAPILRATDTSNFFSFLAKFYLLLLTVFLGIVMLPLKLLGDLCSVLQTTKSKS